MLIIGQDPSITGDLFVAHGISVEQHENQNIADGQGKGKGKAVAQDIDEITSPTETSTDPLTVDWTKYEPPEGLKHLGDIEGIDSEIITQIIQQSIDRIKARILEEQEEKNKSEAETERGSEEGSANEENEAAATSSPGDIEVLPEDLTKVDRPDWPLSSDQDIPKLDDAPRSFLTESPKRPSHRPLLSFFRKCDGAEHGESSAAGAARSRFLTSSSQGELKTHLARKRFVSDLIKRATGEDSSAIEPEGPDVECVSCLDEFPPRRTVRVPCHSYCIPCFQRLISSACQNEQHWPPKCCLNPIPSHTIHSYVDSTQWTEYRDRALEWNQPVSDRIYCSQPECSLFIRPEHVILARGVARCADGHYTCTLCRNAAHEGDACPQDEDVARTNELAEEAGWKRCPRCAAFVEHADGCQHMTCRCGAEFCYVCGASWHTCACTMTHLTTYLREAEARRLERADREAHEEAELAEALRLVAEFEREEEANAAAQRERERQLAEERWRRRYKELEASRREAAARFEELREVVAEVHENQRVVVQEHQDRRERQLLIKGDAVRRQMRDLHELERETQRVKVEQRIVRRREKFRAEYRARAVEEMEIEEQYAAKLRSFWEGREDGEKEVEAAVGDLRRQMDEYFQAWKKWWDNDLATYRHSLREEQAIREELMEEKERRLESRTREIMLGVAKRKTAELRWMREVFEERGRLLDELEASEIEKLGDVSDEFPGDVMEREGWLERLQEE
ncbi:hypothetical protein GGR55DRAFT_694546 [Xylaria sp. FL0064]|nr:hypothetical protein GGR55DRAFT_694546 [Xylaria sp. FL0064]